MLQTEKPRNDYRGIEAMIGGIRYPAEKKYYCRCICSTGLYFFGSNGDDHCMCGCPPSAGTVANENANHSKAYT